MPALVSASLVSELEHCVLDPVSALTTTEEKLQDAEGLPLEMSSVQTKYKNLCAQVALIRTKSQVASALKAKERDLKKKIAEVEANIVLRG